MPTNQLVARQARAARQTVQLATRAALDQLSLPTPCAGWDLRRLLDHMTTENLGFAAAAQGRGADPAVWAGDLHRADPVADYVAATEVLVAAFAEPDVLQRSFALPLLTREQEFPGEQAVMMQLVDSVAHAWDLARTLGIPLTVDDDITGPVLALCEQLPDDESRRAPGSPFGPAVAVPDDTPPLDRIVALLGRSPTWPA
ncbi:MAG: TIGR03086 family metal-binding protein [Dermatophilaceae bacterium]